MHTPNRKSAGIVKHLIAIYLLMIAHTTYAFQILIDTNSMLLSEGSQATIISSDGVLSYPIWSDNFNYYGQWQYLGSGYINWTTVMQKLNANSHTISEDDYRPGTSSPFVFQRTAEFFSPNRPVDAAIAFIEGDDEGHETLTTSEIETQAAYTGRPIVVLTRNYAVGSDAHTLVNAALDNSSCAGVAFELNPGSNLGNTLAGIEHCITDKNKKCYVMMPPYSMVESGNYLSDVATAMTSFGQLPSSVLNSDKLFFVLAIYPRDNSGVGFLMPDAGAATNSVFAASAYLKAYRSGFVSPLVNGATYRLVPMHSGKPLEMNGGQLHNGAQANQWAINEDYPYHQHWTATPLGGGYWKLTNVNSGKCLQPPNYSSGSTLVQWTWTGSSLQQWSFSAVGDGSYLISNRGTGLVMDIVGGSTGNYAWAQQHPNSGGAHQHWVLQRVN